jgi:hypothetical protein
MIALGMASMVVRVAATPLRLPEKLVVATRPTDRNELRTSSPSPPVRAVTQSHVTVTRHSVTVTVTVTVSQTQWTWPPMANKRNSCCVTSI